MIIHELGHAVGFHHEQNRPDRDHDVIIQEDNVQPKLLHNFIKYPRTTVDTFGLPYDYSSVMHYGSRAFSANGDITIRTRDPSYQNVIGNRRGLSFYDVMTANKMYQCSEGCDLENITCPSNSFVGKDCKCWCEGSPVGHCGVSGKGKSELVCTDRIANCRSLKGQGYCDNEYRDQMREICPRTCDLCPGVNESGLENTGLRLRDDALALFLTCFVIKTVIKQML